MWYGLGSISPSQADYWQATRGGGHGDYRTIVLAPHTVQELAELTMDAFDMADFYRNPVLILSDGLLGQMMESVTLPDPQERRRNGWLAGRELPPKTWALTGARGRPAQFIRSLFMVPGELEKHNLRLAEKYATLEKNDACAELTGSSEPQIVLAAYGSSARLAKGALEILKAHGVRAALFRPITLWPFPRKALAELAARVDRFLVVEMSLGQFIEDVQLSVAQEKSLKQVRIELLGRPGGGIPLPEEIAGRALEVLV